jgi:hypothetical protein
MRRTTKLRVVALLLLLMIFLGGSAVISTFVTEVLFAVALAIAVGLVIFCVVGPRFKKKRK